MSCKLKSKIFKAAILLVAVVSGFASGASACGPSFPNNLLDAGDHAVLQPPVANFQSELERMKLVTTKFRAVPLAATQKFYEQSTEVEMTDLAAALKRGKISSEQATVIMQAHLAERMKLNAFLKAQNEWSHFHSGIFDTNWNEQPNTNPPPVFPAVAVTPGLPREFALYFQGAIAWQKHAGWTPCEFWELLLDLPPSERRFKSTWAEFMLAQYYEHLTNNFGDSEAMKHFAQVSTLATNGFADSLGLVTASIGGEAKIYLRQKNFERAIELYLEQLAAGDDTALDSLRFAAARAVAETNSSPAQLKILARNPRPRGVITAYLISRNPYADPHAAETSPDAKQFFDRTTAWLDAVESAKVKDVACASQLALAAYQASRMEIAQRWINRANGELVAQWLQAKLFMRAGKISEAAKLLAKLSRKLPQDLPGTNAPTDFAESLFVDTESVWHKPIAVGRQTVGELGVLHLARREYAEALDALLRSGYWMDAAYVAERVLTTEELKAYVDRNWPPLPPADQTKEIREIHDGEWGIANLREGIRCLLARRLARETMSRDARFYFPTNYSDTYEKFLAELRDGRDETLSLEIRGKNLFAAAVLARTNGMELFGTELEPDWTIYGGAFEASVMWKDRATNGWQAKINLAGTNEIARASLRHVDPEKRFHYRYPAAELAWAAARLMPDNSDETARVLCTGGTWLKNTDPTAADKFYKALVRRCRKTNLGDQADKTRWFPAQDMGGHRPRLETVVITPDLTNAVSSNSENIFSTDFPVPGRKYVVHEDEDVYLLARAVQRLGGPMSAEEILQANPGLKPGPITEIGRVIMIPEASTGATNSLR